ncbi:MAG TPA: hypothetical protein VLH56_00210 [Dissulfurispiraceae bacterium]|nr:hypothetical protein [Dissulfurispiraceae bacterium]
MSGELWQALMFMVVFVLGAWGGLLLMCVFNLSRSEEDERPGCVKIGPYTLSNYDEDCCYISHESGEGGTFKRAEVLAMLCKFYEEKF